MTPTKAREIAAAARALAELADAAAAEMERDRDSSSMLSEREAACLAGVSVRVLRAARRADELTFYGRQRSRTVRRVDLLAWIESRRVPVARRVRGESIEEDDDIARRVRAKERARALSGGSPELVAVDRTAFEPPSRARATSARGRTAP